MNIIFLEQVDSTNTYGKQKIDEFEDKTVISANYQSAGRGRFTRSWVDVGCENIYMSLILKPGNRICPVYANLTQFLSVCLCKELESMGLSPQIKWPNDVLINDKKVCGILAETAMKNGTLKGIVLGIGVNLNASNAEMQQIDRPATSVNIESGMPVDKKIFMDSLLKRFFDGYDEFLRVGFESIKKYYSEKSLIKVGEIVKIAVFDKTKVGEFQGFDEYGNMLLQVNNCIEKVNMGEIV